MTEKSVQELLNEPIPEAEIESKQGLDYVRGGWVTQRMNEIFGFDGWHMTVSRIERFTQEGKKGPQPCVLATVKLEVAVQSEGCVRHACREDVGCGTGFGMDGWHQAAGEAVTDALKRAASRLGVNLGGMLYLRDGDARRVPAELQELAESSRQVIDSAESMNTLESAKPFIGKLKGTPFYKDLVTAYKAKKEEIENE